MKSTAMTKIDETERELGSIYKTHWSGRVGRHPRPKKTRKMRRRMMLNVKEMWMRRWKCTAP